jgi:hypothetical protein
VAWRRTQAPTIPQVPLNKIKNVGNCKGLGGGLRLPDMGIEGRLRDAHHLADLLHRQPLLLVKLYGPFLFTSCQRLGASAQAASDPGSPKSRLRALLDELPFEFCQCRKEMEGELATYRRSYQWLLEDS